MALTIQQERTQNLIEGLCEAIQECYDDGNYVSQDVVHQTAMEMFEDDEVLVAMFDDEDDIRDFLLDDVIGNISINL